MFFSRTGGTLIFMLLLASLLPLGPAWADPPRLSAGLGAEFASGSYGTGTRTDSLYVPVTLALQATERVGFSLEIPYVYQSSSAVNSGLFAGAGGQGMHGQRTAAMNGPGMGSGAMSSSTSSRTSASQSGLGDVMARGGYLLVQEGALVPRVRPYLQLKFPTGDEEKALGTGSFDQTVAVELFKQIGDWYAFAEGGYTFQGSSERLALRDYLSYHAALGYPLGEKVLPLLIVKGATAPVEGSSDLLELRLKLKYLATEKTGIEGYLAKGITRNSPDYGGGLAICYDF